MSNFSRYPHVKNLIEHYAGEINRPEILIFLRNGLKSESDAESFSRFIWEMLDQMSEDEENKVTVLGSTDNSSMIPDIEYEVSLYLSNSGFEEIWDRICDKN